MAISYEVIPWDLQGFGIYDRQFPTVGTLEEAAKAMKSPADCIIARESGKQRPLTAKEWAELRVHQEHILNTR